MNLKIGRICLKKLKVLTIQKHSSGIEIQHAFLNNLRFSLETQIAETISETSALMGDAKSNKNEYKTTRIQVTATNKETVTFTALEKLTAWLNKTL